MTLWVAACLVVGAYLLGAHLLTLPVPDENTIEPNRHDDQRGQWLVLHVLSEQCKCSQRILDHLLDAPRPTGVIERVVLVSDGDVSTAAIRAAGFDVDVVSPEQLVAEYHVDVAPLLVVYDASDHIRYVGGYTPRKQAADIRDVAIIEDLRDGKDVAVLPAFGCAVGRAMTARVDPFGIRTWR